MLHRESTVEGNDMTLARIPIISEPLSGHGDRFHLERQHSRWVFFLVAFALVLIVAVSALGIWLFISHIINLSPLPELPELIKDDLLIGIPIAAIAIVVSVIYAARKLLESNLHRTNFQGASLPEANLQWVDLAGAKLQGADLQRADLVGANLQKADLRQANLLWANLEYANLQGANLQGADLRGANLRRANLWGAKLPGANLQRTNLQWADLQRVDLKGANLRSANLQDTTIDPDTDFSQTRNWREASWDEEVYKALMQRYGHKQGIA
ncbi:MAG: Pentapeptide repeat family protein [Dehalococcoidia bacterium]|nr:Pentapeptide repeat family protein [Dehalococcoidia bacterium]